MTVSVGLGAILLTTITSSSVYATVDQGNAYHLGRLHNSEWLVASEATKLKALTWATRQLDDLQWAGDRVSTIQVLRWPRNYVNDRDGTPLDNTAIPQVLINATAELAWEGLKADRTVDNSAIGIRKVLAGAVNVHFDRFDRPTRIPVAVSRMISHILEPGGAGTGGAVATLLRS